MADATKELVIRDFFDQIPPESGRVYEVSSTPEGKTLIKDVTAYQQGGTPWTAADAAQAINGLPPIGDITFGFYRITYPDDDVNAKTYPWVNFDDNLLPAKYPQLYALYGNTLSSGAPSGYFNLKKLADRFPLVSASNFASTGGEAKVALTEAQGPRHKHTRILLGGNGGSPVYWGADAQNNVHNAWGYTYGSGGTNYLDTSYSGAGNPHNNMPPYITVCAHIRAA